MRPVNYVIVQLFDSVPTPLRGPISGRKVKIQGLDQTPSYVGTKNAGIDVEIE